jgi:hypothetical protein
MSVRWPDGKRFAFSIFDDPDAQTLAEGRRVYSFLADLGFRTTRGVWPLGATREVNSPGETCANPEYLAHNLELQKLGFEMGYHNATPHSVVREETRQALDLFKSYFGNDPRAMANHYNRDAIYWGSARLTGSISRAVYGASTLSKNNNRFRGEIEGEPEFWGDLCRDRIEYCRNFVYADIDTLAVCPWMPYHDPLRPFVRNWYSAADGANIKNYLRMLTESNQDRLEEQGGACIMYTHFGHGFVENEVLHSRFSDLMTRLSKKNGWFVPVSTLLDYVADKRGRVEIGASERNRLQNRWLWQKVFRGTS